MEGNNGAREGMSTTIHLTSHFLRPFFLFLEVLPKESGISMKHCEHLLLAKRILGGISDHSLRSYSVSRYRRN